MDITVVGTARASLAPERGTVTLRIGHQGYRLEDVVERTEAAVGRTVAVVDELQGRAPSPTTWSAVLPVITRSWVPYHEGKPQAVRFAAAAVVKVKFSDFIELGQFATDQGQIEGVSVDGIEWTLTEATRAAWEAKVLADAVTDARRRAGVIAEAAGGAEPMLVEVADPGLLGDGRSAYEQGRTAAARSAASGGDHVVRPEDVVISTTVNARFRA